MRWFHVDEAGREHEFRRVEVALSSPMRLMMNHWVGNDSAGAVGFLGHHDGGSGAAYYDWVRVSD